MELLIDEMSLGAESAPSDALGPIVVFIARSSSAHSATTEKQKGWLRATIKSVEGAFEKKYGTEHREPYI